MNALDYVIIAIYLIGFLLLGYLFKNAKSGEDYFLGGRSFKWFPLALSTVATQLSAISFISAPAFVGLKDGGGMMWLTYEFAVPIAMIFLMVWLIPPMFKLGIVSVYEMLEKRYHGSTRVLLSVFFQLSRGFATSVMVYTVALILTSVMDIPIWMTILVIGVVTLIYSYQGGMKAVVYGDMIQMIILFLGILICLGYGLSYLEGWDGFMSYLDRDRVNVIDFQAYGFDGGKEFGFWPMLLGGFFLYASYYGTDQSQVQRLFSAKDLGTVRKALLTNGLIRFPITFIYCLMGLILGAFVASNEAFRAAIPMDKPDLMVPIFIRDFLPNGIIGILMVAIFSAAMSSLSSTINSLSAASIEDIFNRKKQLSSDQYMRYSRWASLFWGVVCIVLAFYTGDIADTVIEAINKIGSVFYGPIFATFVAAILLRRTNFIGANIGLVLGVGVNVYLWLFQPDIFWFWWNAIGALVTLSAAVIFSEIFKTGEGGLKVARTEISIDYPKTIILAIFAVFIILFSYLFPSFFG
ncbi:MAG: sodium:solute symporter [Bacteroidota bacterium]